MDDLVYRQAVIAVIKHLQLDYENAWVVREAINALPSAEPEIAEKLYLYKCYITDEDGLQHEVIHTGDIRRVTGWEI